MLALALLSAGAASAATPTAKKIAALQKDVKALKSTVKKQQKTIRSLTIDIGLNYISDACIMGITADAIQGTWVTVDPALANPVFGPQQAIGDRGACSVLTNPNVVREGLKTPPTMNVFNTMIAWLCLNQSCASSSFGRW
jgi:hypothetical protein